MKLIDNRSELLIEDLNGTITSDSDIHISCNYFTVYALFEMLESFRKANSIQVLISGFDQEQNDIRFLQHPVENGLSLQLDRPYRAKTALKLIEDKITLRSGGLGNQNMVIISGADKVTCYSLTPMNIDLVSLGKIQSDTPIFINKFEDTNGQFFQQFQRSWENSKDVLNTSVSDIIKKGTSTYSGNAIYKYSLREIFEYSSVTERADERLEKIGFKNSKVWGLLYNFQKDAVIGAIEKIETFGGCIIADSVGLGKTFEALAVMKYYQLRNDRILVLAPKKLRENWTIYQLNDKRNILAEDRLNYDVLNHTDLSRTRGKSGDIDLETINWGNYDLVVIDESHNFRNNPNKKGMTRYRRLMNDVIKSNIRTKVLMLSATPVNNRMNDLKNQISFITEGDDEAFQDHGIESVTVVMREAQRKFSEWFRESDPDNLNVNKLMERLGGEYFRILDMLTIARSRKNVEKYYDTADIGKFPERRTPLTYSPPIDSKDQMKDIGQLYDEISTLTLAAYTPLAYVRADKREEYEQKYDIQTRTGSIFKQADREQSLIYLMRVNLLKRLESSIHSFHLTVDRLINFIDNTLQQVDSHETGELSDDISITEVDIDDTELEDLLVGGKTKVLIQDLDLIRWKQDLQQDKKVLFKLMDEIEAIDVSRDAKIQQLQTSIEEKLRNPINQGNKKVIVFSAFADTASYLYGELSDWLKKEHGLYSGLVTGSGTNKTNMPKCRSDLSSLLTNFSPRSKRRNEVYPELEDEIDVLFCTDCISEGQNLQDCDYLVNYDIHWNPVRIIQRFGRIDRIGSTNEQIQLVNFFPNMELDSFIDLVARVQGRMVMLDVSATGEDNVISKNSREMQDLDYRKRQLKQLQNQVIDLEDVQGNISITDLTFNDFKIDLEKSSSEELGELNAIPPASCCVVWSNLEQIQEGVIFCLKDTSTENQEKLKSNILYPYFLVYMSLDGTDVVKATQTKLALDYFRKLCLGEDEVVSELVAEFEKETKGFKKMDAYVDLLRQAIEQVVDVQDDIGLDSLASSGATTMKSGVSDGEDEIELVSYVIIR